MKHQLFTFLLISLLSVAARGQNFLPAVPMASVPLLDQQSIDRVVFGSCNKQGLDQSIFDTVANTRGDVFMLIGDNVYSEDESDDPKLQSLRDAYGLVAESKPFERLRETMPLLVTWDDHDYGVNDGGGDWPWKAQSQALYNHAWAIPDEDPRAKRDGVYFSRTVGPVGQRVQLIVLDTRYFRSPLKLNDANTGGGKYVQSDGENEMLGEAQWQWLEQAFKAPADVRILATSVQMIATGHSWEAWHLMPDERMRFYELVTRTSPNGLVMISGDRHMAAIYKQTEHVPYPLWEVTSSSLNLPLSDILDNIIDEPGELRIGDPYYDANFGLIDIDWVTRKLLLQVRDDRDRAVLSVNVDL
ncbi:MAG: alkaline phosphatase D, partial [Sulfitobacter sp.]